MLFSVRVGAVVDRRILPVDRPNTEASQSVAAVKRNSDHRESNYFPDIREMVEYPLKAKALIPTGRFHTVSVAPRCRL